MGKKKARNTRTTPAKKSKLSLQVDTTPRPAVSTAVAVAVDLVPRGLQNIGNTCFFNSVLQALSTVHCAKVLRSEYANPCGKLTMAMHTTINQLFQQSSPRRISFNPSQLFDAIGQESKQFKGRRQQDAHELFMCLLDKLDDERKATKIEEHKITTNAILGPFEGTLASIVACCRCQRKTNSIDAFLCLSLQIPGSEHLNKYPVFEVKKTKQDKKTSNVWKKTLMNNSEPIKAITDNVSSGGVDVQITVEIDEKDHNLVSTEHTEAEAPEADPTLVATISIREHIDNDVSDHSGASADHLAHIERESLGGADVLVACGPNLEKEIAELPCCANISSCEAIEASGSTSPRSLILEPPLPQVSMKLSTGDSTNNTSTPSSTTTATSPLNLKRCLNSFTTVEKLLKADGNGFNCTNCREIVDAEKRVVLLRTPETLVLHLKRLLPGGKQSAFVRYAHELDIENYVAFEVEEDGSAAGEGRFIGDPAEMWEAIRCARKVHSVVAASTVDATTLDATTLDATTVATTVDAEEGVVPGMKEGGGAHKRTETGGTSTDVITEAEDASVQLIGDGDDELTVVEALADRVAAVDLNIGNNDSSTSVVTSLAANTLIEKEEGEEGEEEEKRETVALLNDADDREDNLECAVESFPLASTIEAATAAANVACTAGEIFIDDEAAPSSSSKLMAHAEKNADAMNCSIEFASLSDLSNALRPDIEDHVLDNGAQPHDVEYESPLRDERGIEGGSNDTRVQGEREICGSSGTDVPSVLHHSLTQYTLSAVVVHQGGAFGGHYVAYIKRDGTWYYTSDSTVRKCLLKEVMELQAYMLFYSR